MDDEEKIAKIYHLLKDTPMEYILENPLLLKIEKVIDEDKTNTADKEKLEAIKEILRTLILNFNKIQNIDYDKTRMERTIEKEVEDDIHKIKAILGIPV